MSIVAADILLKLSVRNGSAGNSLAQSDPAGSLGKYISTTRWGSTALNGAIGANDTTILVQSAAGLPPSGSFDIQIEQERLTVTAGAGGTSWTVTRGVGGTVAAAHADGAVVESPLRLFDRITGDENAASVIDYRCVFVHNSHATLTLLAPVVWISSEVSGGALSAIGVDPTVASAIGASAAQAVEITNENAAPAGVTFSSPTNKGAGLALGDILPGQCKAIWIRRSAANTAALANDGVGITIEGDTF